MLKLALAALVISYQYAAHLDITAKGEETLQAVICVLITWKVQQL